MSNGPDWVDDGTLSRDETVQRLTALNPAPTESDDLHRAVARMAARLMLFSDSTTRAEIVDNAALFAAEVIELVEPVIRNDERERGDVAASMRAARADERQRLRRGVEALKKSAYDDYKVAVRDHDAPMSITAGAQMIAHEDVLDLIAKGDSDGPA